MLSAQTKIGHYLGKNQGLRAAALVAELTVAKYMHRTSDRPLSGRRGRRGCVVRAEQSNGVSSPLSPPGNTGAAPSPVSRLTHDSGIGLSLIPTGARTR